MFGLWSTLKCCHHSKGSWTCAVGYSDCFSVLDGNETEQLGLRWLSTRFFISNSFCVTDEGRDVMCGALDLIFNCDESRTDNGGSARLKADTVRD